MTAAVLPAGTIGPSSSAVAPVTVEEGTADAWNRYVQAHADATSDHLWPWRSIFEKVFGHETVYLVARRHDTVAGVLPLVLFKSRLFGRSVVSLPVLNYGGVRGFYGSNAGGEAAHLGGGVLGFLFTKNQHWLNPFAPGGRGRGRAVVGRRRPGSRPFQKDWTKDFNR